MKPGIGWRGCKMALDNQTNRIYTHTAMEVPVLLNEEISVRNLS